MADRNTVKQWFQTGDFPTQAQFYAWLDSIPFTGDIQMTDILNLVTTLQGKTEKGDFELFQKGELITAGANYIYQHHANDLIEMIIIIPGADADIRIGTTDGGEEISPEESVLLTDETTQVRIINSFTLTDRNIYINGIPANTKLVILKRPIKIQ